LRIVEVTALVHSEAQNNPACYSLPCEEDIARAQAENDLRVAQAWRSPAAAERAEAVSAVRLPRASEARARRGPSDLRWEAETGFAYHPGRGRPARAARGRVYLQTHAAPLSHAFFSFQPRDRAQPCLSDYAAAWDDLEDALPSALPLALQPHGRSTSARSARTPGPGCSRFTASSRALRPALGQRGRRAVVDRRPAAARNPLPPVLDAQGLAADLRELRECQDGLPVPLLLEFPAFRRG
jgi:hypothetical protein